MRRFWLTAILIPLSAAQAQVPATSERIEVNILEVTAVVRDASGKPVTGLTSGDFELRVDGKNRAITNFYEVNRRSDGSPQTASNDAAPRRDYVVLFIDDLHLNQHEKARALDASRRFVQEHVRNGTSAMLVESNGDVRIVEKFTDDASRLTRAIDQLEQQPAHINELETERRELLRMIDSARKEIEDTGRGGHGYKPDRGTVIRRQIESFARNQREMAEATVAALDHVIHAVEGLDGRRTLVYVSDGLPMQPAAEVFQYFKPDELLTDETSTLGRDDSKASTAEVSLERILAQAQPGDAMSMNLNTTYADFARQAALAGVQFFAINARGVKGFDEGAESSTTSRLDSSLIRSNLLGPIKMVADETGGEAIVDTNDMNLAFARLNEDLSSYYSLGFRSEGSDRESDIKVQVKRRGATVHAVRSIKQQTNAEQIANRARAALYAPIADNPLDAEVSLGPLADGVGLRATVRLPVAKLSILPQNGVSAAAFTVFVTMLDESMRETPVRMFMHRITAAEAEESIHSLRLEVPPGRYTVSLAIADAFSSSVSYVQREVTVGRPIN